MKTKNTRYTITIEISEKKKSSQKRLKVFKWLIKLNQKWWWALFHHEQ